LPGSAYDGRSYMVGALPRLTLNGNRTSGPARQAMKALKLKLPCSNIVMNNIAQVVEMVYSVEHAMHLVNELLEAGAAQEKPVPYKVHACSGAAATEVPRGTLFYSNEIDAQGKIAAAVVITPTAQNLSNAEDQLRETVKQGLGAGASDSTIEQRLAIVARAYDPYISC
jgi:sulfhydrogenase subunit alpha